MAKVNKATEYYDYIMSILDRAQQGYRTFFHFGSRTIEGAAREDSDYDFMLLTGYDGPTVRLVVELTKEGFVLSGDEEYGPLQSWRKGELNLVTTNDSRIYDGHRKANAVCKFLKVTDKSQRVAVFDLIVHAKHPETGAVMDGFYDF